MKDSTMPSTGAPKVSGGASNSSSMPGIPAMPDSPDTGMLHEHEFDTPETHDHLNTLVKAEGIKADKVKMARVQALAGRHEGALKAIRSVQDLKAIYDQKFGSGKQPPIPQLKAGPDQMPKMPKLAKAKIK